MKETIQKELGLTSMLLIDQRTGVDMQTAHPDDPICSEKRKQVVSDSLIVEVWAGILRAQ